MLLKKKKKKKEKRICVSAAASEGSVLFDIHLRAWVDFSLTADIRP